MPILDHDGRRALLRLSGQVEDPARRRELVEPLVRGILIEGRDFFTNLESIAEAIPLEGDERDELVTSLGLDLMRLKQEEAMTWMLEQLVGNRSEAMRSGVERWVKQDADRVATWIETLPISVERDVAITVFARQVAKTDPETALAWVTEIADVEQRQAIRDELLQANPQGQ